jgi:hypothetical protein
MSRESIIGLLRQLAEVIGPHDQRWAQHMNILRERVEYAPNADLAACLAEIMGLFGGMASFSDLVLHREGEPLTEENTRLDALRRELHDALLRDLE